MLCHAIARYASRSRGLNTIDFGKRALSLSSTSATNTEVVAHTVYKPPEEETALPLIITHGFLGSKTTWNSIAKATARATNRRVITFDARNHGDSFHSAEFNYYAMADDILRLVQHLSIDKFALSGHSMGGRTAMAFALKYPEAVEKLVIVDVSPLEVNVDFATMRVYVHTLREIQNRTTGLTRTLSEVRKATDETLKPVIIDPAVRNFLLTNLATKDGKIYWKPNLKILTEKFDEVGNFPQELLEKTFDKPTLFIRGQKSLYIPLSDFPKIKKTFLKAHLTTVENAGHWPHAENTIRFMERYLPFMNGEVCH